jgi:hypothetical protein
METCWVCSLAGFRLLAIQQRDRFRLTTQHPAHRILAGFGQEVRAGYLLLALPSLCPIKLQLERSPEMPIPTNYIESALAEFRSNRDIVRDILETLPEPAIHDNHGAVNSIAILVQHLHGAHFRRWTDLFTAKPAAVPGNPQEWKEERFLSKAELSALNEEGWDLVIRTLEGFTETDLGRPAPVRGAEGPLLHAILYHWSHYSYHLGQIILLAKIATQGNWTVAAAKRNSEARKAAVAV